VRSDPDAEEEPEDSRGANWPHIRFEGTAGAQAGSGNVQYNYFYGYPARADGASLQSLPPRPLGSSSQGHAFISYVREDAREVDALQGALESAGVRVWRDTADLWPGENWRAKIREAITHDALVFIACFSSRSAARRESFANEELILAIGQLRLRRLDDPWLIPVRLDDCEVPELDLGGGQTLASIQRADLFGPNRDEATRRLVAAVQRLLQPAPISPPLVQADAELPDELDAPTQTLDDSAMDPETTRPVPKTPKRAITRRRLLMGAAAAVIIIGTAVGLILELSPATPRKPPPTAGPSPSHTPAPVPVRFVSLGSTRDTAFNELLAINDEGVIAGYSGLGTKGHPSKGYVMKPPYAQDDIVSENYPRSVQTLVTGLNDEGVTVGVFSMQNNAKWSDDNNFGFYAVDGHFHEVNFPAGDNSSPPVDQLLGVNNHDVAVGFYKNSAGRARSYTYDIATRAFSPVTGPDAPSGDPLSLTATAINNSDDVAGFYTTAGGTVDGFLKSAGGVFTPIAVPGAAWTKAWGVNDNGMVVGTYTDDTGTAVTQHGFIWLGGRFTTSVDDPNGATATLLNGVNNKGNLVGAYIDQAGDTNGVLTDPKS
jgi:hypothetical protein